MTPVSRELGDTFLALLGAALLVLIAEVAYEQGYKDGQKAKVKGKGKR